MYRKRRFILLSRKNRVWLCFLAPSLLGVLIFVCLPFLDVVRRTCASAVSARCAGLASFRAVFENGAFRLAVWNTFRFTAVCLPLLVGLGLFAAVQLSRLKNGQRFKTMFLFPMAVPAAAIVLVWKMVFSSGGFLNLLLNRLGLLPDGMQPDYMASGAAFWVLVFTYVWKNLGYTVVLWLAGLASVPESIVRAARVDGASQWKCFWRIVLPNLKGSLYTITVLSFLNSFKVFREAYLVAGSYPDESMYLLQHLFNNWFVNLDLDKMAAAAVCVGIVLFLAILVLQRFWDREG